MKNESADLSFTGKIVFVSGGSRGIGRGIAEAFAARGADVVIAARDTESVTDAAAAIDAAGTGSCTGFTLDVTDEESVAKGIAGIAERFGGLDIAVNNAGVANSIAFRDLDGDAWDRVIDTNLKGVYTCCRHELSLLEQRGGGSIVNIASISGSMVNVPQFQANYNTSKAGVIMLTRSLAVEYAPKGVRVNSVSPGYTLTDMNRRAEVQELIAVWRERTPMGRLAEVREVSGPVLFLASDLAGYVTGHDLVVDGGITIVC